MPNARKCLRCNTSLASKRSHAIYCSRNCKALAGAVRWRVRNPDADRLRYAGEAERRRAYAREYGKRRPEVSQVKNRNRRAQRAGQRFTTRDWVRLCRRYGGRCAYCHQVPTAGLTIEHVIPLIRGGVNTIGNIVPACRSCNFAKHTRFLTEWRRDQRRQERCALAAA
jgi:5-methylcytosine-specific restriction endonuclease McrA